MTEYEDLKRQLDVARADGCDGATEDAILDEMDRSWWNSDTRRMLAEKPTGIESTAETFGRMPDDIRERAWQRHLLGSRALAEHEAWSIWLPEWVQAWAIIGWLASTDIMQALHAHALNRVHQVLVTHQTKLDNVRVTLDDLLKSVQQLRQRVR